MKHLQMWIPGSLSWISWPRRATRRWPRAGWSRSWCRTACWWCWRWGAPGPGASLSSPAAAALTAGRGLDGVTPDMNNGYWSKSIINRKVDLNRLCDWNNTWNLKPSSTFKIFKSSSVFKSRWEGWLIIYSSLFKSKGINYLAAIK